MKNALIIEIQSFVYVISPWVSISSANQLLGKQHCSLKRSLSQSQDPPRPLCMQLRTAPSGRHSQGRSLGLAKTAQ